MMSYKGYTAKVEVDPDAGIIHGEVVGVRDVVTFQAERPRDLTRAFRKSVDDYLNYCKSRGEPPEKPASGKFVVRVPSDTHRKLVTLARQTDQSLNALVTSTLEKAVSKTRA